MPEPIHDYVPGGPGSGFGEHWYASTGFRLAVTAALFLLILALLLWAGVHNHARHTGPAPTPPADHATPAAYHAPAGG